MSIRNILMILVCGISILYTQPAYTKVSSIDRSILEDNTDLKNIEDITQGIFKNITQKIPVHILKESIIFIPDVRYTSNSIFVQTVFDSVFTQTLIATFTKHGVSVAPYSEKKKLLVEYEKSLQQKLQEKSQVEKKTAEEIRNLQVEIGERKRNISLLENKLKETEETQKKYHQTVLNTKNASRSLLVRYEEDIARETQYISDIYELKKKSASLQKEIDLLNISLFKINQQIQRENHTQETIQFTSLDTIEKSTQDTPIMLEKIQMEIKERTQKLKEINSEITYKTAELTTIQEQKPTMIMAIEQSKTRILELEMEYNLRTQNIELYTKDIQKENDIVYSLESKVIALKGLNPVALPKVYEIQISYSNAESVLFITSEVFSGLHNTTVFLSQDRTHMTPYTATLLQQRPISVKPYTIRSVTVQKPKVAKPITVSNERGVH